ncbi:hypothetical protein MMC12_008031 [Toensbergia leucococca]|nr:hypothetical protein [Toensbergia leucococca]
MCEKASVFKYATFNTLALCQLASKMRGGRSCICDTCQIPACGSFNWTILISFVDRVEWVLRSPRDDGAIKSNETNLLLLASEAATLKYIKANSTIPVPDLFAYRQVDPHVSSRLLLTNISYSCSWDNEIGIPFILMSKARGLPLQYTWKADMSNEQKAKILFQLGVITEQLSQLRFDQAGSLFEEDEVFHIKTCLSRGLLLNERHALEDVPRGPFNFARDYYEAQIRAFLDHVKYLPLGHHCFFAPIPAQNEYDDFAKFQKASDWWSDFVTVQSKIDSSDNRADYVVAGEMLSDTIAKWADDLTDILPSYGENRFAIHHPDLSVNNIFIDEDLNITCIIDWAFCSAVPLSMLLTPPGLPQSRNELDVPLLAAFENGFQQSLLKNTQYQGVGTEKVLGWMTSRGRQMWLLSRILSFDTTTDYHLFQAFWDLVGGYSQDMVEFFRSKQSSKDCIALHRELKEDDQTTEQVARLERAYFRDIALRLAISRKLTLVSQWSNRYGESGTRGIRSNGNVFVADKRLWSWIDSCLIF